MSKAKFIEIVKDFNINKVVILVSKRNCYYLTFNNTIGFLGTIKTVNQKDINKTKKQTYNNSIDFYNKIKRLAYYKQMYVYN